MLLAAAMSSVVRKKTYMSSRADVVLKYMKSLRLGQTSIGSYVVNVIAPMPSRTGQLDPELPFARTVTENLGTALLALNDAAESYQRSPDLTVFDAIVERGVSSNMCDAVLGLGGPARQRTVVVSVDATPTLANELAPVSVEFRVDHFSAIEVAADYLKGEYVLKGQAIRGFVKRLDREHGNDEGLISITAVLLGKNEKHVAVPLRPSDYAEAIKAHERGLLVEVRGDIYVTPRTATMINPSGFRVFQNGDFFNEDGT